MSVRVAPGSVMKYGLISPRTVEPGQKERVPLMVSVYALSRHVQLSDLSIERCSFESFSLERVFRCAFFR